MTNRHVVQGAERVEISTSDGETIDATDLSVAMSSDLALVRVTQRLPVAATPRSGIPERGAMVTAVGYPNAGAFHMSKGPVVDMVRGAPFDESGEVLRANLTLKPGNSGGPVLNEHGDFIGVAFAIERSTSYALIIPASALRSALAGRAFERPQPGCE